MGLKLYHAATVLAVALVTGLTFAHVLEWPARMHFGADLYITLLDTPYVHWGPLQIGDVLEPAAIAAVGLLGYLRRRSRRDRWLVLGALAALLLAFPVVFFALVAPANAAFRAAAPAAPPVDWTTLRAQWELGHALRFGLQLAALGLLVLSLATRSTRRDRPAPPGP